MAQLEGKVALITGGNSGIGRAAALAFAREGAKVVIAARGIERGEEVVHEISAAGGQAIFVRADMSRSEDIEALTARAVDAFGQLDCAWSNAGFEGTLKMTADFTEEDFDEIIRMNLKVVGLCMRHQIR